MINFAGAIGLIAFFGVSTLQATSYPASTDLNQAETSLSDEAILTATASPAAHEIWKIGASQFQIFSTVSPSATPTPDIAEIVENPEIIGFSVGGRPIEVYRFGEGQTGRLIVAGIHGGNEWNTIKLAYELIDYVTKNPKIIPKDVSLYILPNLNPDGEARVHGLDGRVNDNGVDLNRNWPYRWVKDYDHESCWHYRPTTAGDYAGSEPETSALISFIETHPEIDALISYHSAALGIFAGGVPDYEPSIKLAEKIAKVSTYQYPPKDVGCVYTGNLTDWASNVREIAAVDIELHNFKFTDFDENSIILKVFLKFKR